jgi:hypothetical protein
MDPSYLPRRIEESLQTSDAMRLPPIEATGEIVGRCHLQQLLFSPKGGIEGMPLLGETLAKGHGSDGNHGAQSSLLSISADPRQRIVF